jgi:hypothetical protein
VKLLPPGEVEAAAIFPLVERLTGLPVVLDGDGVGRTRILITDGIGGQRVTRDEMTVLLAASRIYLYPHDGGDGMVVVASANSRWRPEFLLPRFTKTFRVGSRVFDETRKVVEAVLEKKDRELPPGTPRCALAADPRTGTLVVRAPSEAIIASVEAAVAEAKKRSEEAGSPPHLYTYKPRWRRAPDLQVDLLESLSVGDRQAVSVVIPAGKNVLMIRAGEEAYRRILEILADLDARPAPNRAVETTPEAEGTEEAEPPAEGE